MATKQKSITKTEKENEILLSAIAKTDEIIATMNKELKDHKQRRDNMIWQAQQKGITQAGNYELVQIVKIMRSVDMAVLWTWPERELIQKIAKVSLTDAEKVFGKDRIEEAIIKTPSTSYKVKVIKLGMDSE